MASASTVLPSAPSGVLRDFSDRLSPMLVKELRQGLKSPFFVWGLVVMQAALSIGAVVSMGQTERQAAMFFWWGCSAVICILLPLRVANALRDEMAGNTMDTLVLTRLSAWRITLGKWLATVALQVLMAVTVLPYLIVRYFSGGVNLPQELAMMGVFLLFGILATAVMLGLSFFRYFLIRAAIMAGVLMGCAGFCAVVIEELERRGTDRMASELSRKLGWGGSLGLVLLALWVAFFLLDLGASQIAPPAENRATRRRLVAAGAFMLAGACFWQMKDLVMAVEMLMPLGICAVVAAVQALCEKPVTYAPVLQPFVKRGAAGRLAGRLLYPGWASGVVFSTLLIAGASVFFLVVIDRYEQWVASRYGLGHRSHDPRYDLQIWAFLAALVATVVVPLILWKVLSRRSEWQFWRWLLLFFLPAAFHTGLTLVNSKAESVVVTYAQGVFPSVGFFCEPLADDQSGWDDSAEEDRLMEIYRAKNPGLWVKHYLPPEVSRALIGFQRERKTLHLNRLTMVALVSSGVWLLAAFLLAAREFGRTRRAEDALIQEMKAAKLAIVG